jgi:hypothetical protein
MLRTPITPKQGGEIIFLNLRADSTFCTMQGPLCLSWHKSSQLFIRTSLLLFVLILRCLTTFPFLANPTPNANSKPEKRLLIAKMTGPMLRGQLRKQCLRTHKRNLFAVTVRSSRMGRRAFWVVVVLVMHWVCFPFNPSPFPIPTFGLARSGSGTESRQVGLLRRNM